MDWLWQGLVSNGLWTLLFLGGSIVLGILKARQSRLVEPVLYGAGFFAICLVIFFGFTGRSILSKEQPQTNVNNVESNVKAWCDALRLTVGRIDVPDTYFAFEVGVSSGNRIRVFRGRLKDHYLQFQGTVSIAPEHQKAYQKLSNSEKDALTEKLVVTLSQYKVAYSLTADASEVPQQIYLNIAAPINRELVESSFARDLNDVDNAVQLTRAEFRLLIQKQNP